MHLDTNARVLPSEAHARGARKVVIIGAGFSGAVTAVNLMRPAPGERKRPLLRARDWEATAVPELRTHAARLARHLLTSTAVRWQPELM